MLDRSLASYIRALLDVDFIFDTTAPTFVQCVRNIPREFESLAKNETHGYRVSFEPVVSR